MFFSELYRVAIPGTPVDPWRAERIVVALGEAKLLNERNLRPAPAISWKALGRVHQPEYLDSLTRAGGATRALGVEIDLEHQQRLVDSQRRMCNGTLLAAQAALAGRVGVNLGGGLHHAEPGAGKGFCLFNDVAVAIRALRSGGFEGKVLVIDLDLHDGDGTRRCFADDPTVHTLSIHNQDWDQQPAAEATSIALGAAVDDGPYLAALEQTLPAVLARVEPRLVIYLAGVDGSEHDPLGDWKLTANGLLARDAFVHRLVRDGASSRPLVVLLAGGYGQHAWRPSARFVGWMLSGGRVPQLPDSDRVLLQRYLRVASSLGAAELGGSEPDDGGFGLTEADIMGGLEGSGPPRRFLGFYSRDGLELALERTGYLDRLRALGYPHPHLALAFDSPTGETLRIWADSTEHELLSELRLRLDRHLLPGMTLLFVEWLVLQNPRGAFSPARPRLPGQERPGLGLLKDVVALLVAVCRRLDLDGVAATASHFHLVRQGSTWFQILDPEQARVYREIAAALEGVPLAEASQRLAAGPIVLPDGRRLSWRPTTMVLPVSERLQRALEDQKADLQT